MTLLKYQGIHEEAALMGTQCYFVFSPIEFSLSSKFNSIETEWQQLYGCEIEVSSILEPDELHHQLRSYLDRDRPVCLPVDLYVLPHTLHHQQLHQHHYVNLFGYENGRYYMVCPYYRFQDWVDADLISEGFFSAVVRARGAQLTTIPPFTMPPIDEKCVNTIVEKNCKYMLNLSIPDTLTGIDPQFVGVTGIKTFADHFQQQAKQTNNVTTNKATYINLSRHVTTVGNTRYWLHQLIQAYQPTLLLGDLSQQFTDSIQAWKAIGIQLGMAAHGQRPEIMQRVALSLQDIHRQETRLFNTLLGALPNYEQGTL